MYVSGNISCLAPGLPDWARFPAQSGNPPNLATLAAAVLTTIKTSQKLLTQPRKLKRAIKINWVARLGGKSGPIWQPWWQQT